MNHTKFQPSSSKRLEIIPSLKLETRHTTDDRRHDRRQPRLKNYSPRRNLISVVDKNGATTKTSQTAKTRGAAKSGGPANKNPCGHCKAECSSGNAVPCGFCESWFHSDCIDGMTAEFVASCDAINRLTGGSSFLCVICRKLSAKLNGTMKESMERIKKLEQRLTTADLERKCLTEKISAMENQNRQVNENVMKIETEVASGMVKAKEEVKGELRDEIKARENIKGNIAVYGVAESKLTDVDKQRQDDLEIVKKIAAEIGLKGEM